MNDIQFFMRIPIFLTEIIIQHSRAFESSCIKTVCYHYKNNKQYRFKMIQLDYSRLFCRS